VSNLIPNNWINSCNGRLSAGMALTLHKSQVHCSGVISDELAVHSCWLPRSFACRCRLRNLRADCSAIGLYCVTITWQARSLHKFI